MIDHYLEMAKDALWGAPLLFLLFGTGVYLTIMLKGMQFRYLGYALKQVFAKQKQGASGDISHFDAFMTSLAGAIGTGSIVGVSLAVAVGGLGSIFWMWITALLSMAIKYSESLLAVKYRKIDSRGEMIGGPMSYIEQGLGWKPVAIIFAIFASVAAIGTGNLVQVNSIAGAVKDVWSINPWVTGVILAILTGLVLFRGVKTIGKVSSILVPVMALLYVTAGSLILFLNYQHIPQAFSDIFSSAFHGQAAVGGFAGSTVIMAIQLGVARSVFSNEAGLGISSVASAAAKTDIPARQAMITMTGVLLSTVVICTMTGLVIAVTGVHGSVGEDGAILNGVSLAIQAFSYLVGGNYIVTIGLCCFAFSTVMAWAYYGEKCAEYLFGERSVILYRILYVLLVIPGAAINLEVAWNVADITNALMMIPNLIALIALSKVITSETKSFLVIADQESKMIYPACGRP